MNRINLAVLAVFSASLAACAAGTIGGEGEDEPTTESAAGTQDDSVVDGTFGSQSQALTANENR